MLIIEKTLFGQEEEELRRARGVSYQVNVTAESLKPPSVWQEKKKQKKHFIQ